MYDRILIRYGELTLKGKNKQDFINQCYKTIREKLLDLDVEFEKRYERLYIILNGVDEHLVFERLNTIFGIHSYSLVKTCESDLDVIKEISLQMMKEAYEASEKIDPAFRVTVKRANKRFELTSSDVAKVVSSHVLINSDISKVSLKEPDINLNLEIREEATYIFFNEILGLGGLPVGTSAKALLLLSGGIDSPVAAYYSLKRGVNLELIHFESTPLTPIESAQKVIDLTKKISVYHNPGGIKLYMVPFIDIHQKLLEVVPDNYIITVMRRMMMRISTEVALRNNSKAIISGESLGQVASQTLESMFAINSVTTMPVLRPLVGFDKDEIIKVAEKIDTFNISIKPFEDCCTVYMPKKPTTKPKVELCERYEAKFDFEKMIEEVLEKIQTVRIKPTTEINLPEISFQVELPKY